MRRPTARPGYVGRTDGGRTSRSVRCPGRRWRRPRTRCRCTRRSRHCRGDWILRGRGRRQRTSAANGVTTGGLRRRRHGKAGHRRPLRRPHRRLLGRYASDEIRCAEWRGDRRGRRDRLRSPGRYGLRPGNVPSRGCMRRRQWTGREPQTGQCAQDDPEVQHAGTGDHHAATPDPAGADAAALHEHGAAGRTVRRWHGCAHRRSVDTKRHTWVAESHQSALPPEMGGTPPARRLTDAAEGPSRSCPSLPGLRRTASRPASPRPW